MVPGALPLLLVLTPLVPSGGPAGRVNVHTALVLTGWCGDAAKHVAC